MPQTLTGWLLLAANLLAIAGAANTAGNIIASLYGKFERGRFDIVVLLAFVGAVFVSDLLLHHVERPALPASAPPEVAP